MGFAHHPRWLGRVSGGETQVGSTVATSLSFILPAGVVGETTVRAVDDSGNQGP